MKITISVDNPSLTYFAGQAIYGSVILHATGDTATSGLKIKCIGLAKVKWTERRGKSTLYRSDQHTYIACKTYLIGSQGGPEVSVQAGVQRFPFIFQLPRNIPSSFCSTHGRIEYYLQATFKRSWKFDAETRLNFSINALVDLNAITIPNVGSVGLPLQLFNQKSLELCCHKTRPISFKIILNQGGFVSGQQLKYSLHVANLSNRKVKSCTVTFMKGETYKAGVYTKSQSDILMKFKHSEVPKGEERSWPENGFKVPSLAPTGLGGCHLIELKYWIEVRVKIFCRSSLKGELPIIIGNIPLRSHFNSVPMPAASQPVLQTEASSSHTRGSASTPPIKPSDPLVEYPELPPPTYEEVAGKCPTYEQVQLAELETETHIYLQNRSFAPKYPNYHSWD